MLGFICALGIEVEGIVKLMENKEETTIAKITYHKGEIYGKEVVCCECGIGKVNAAICTQILCDCYQVTHLVNTGIAGSLCAELDIGDLVVSRDAMYHDFDCNAFGYPHGKVPGMDVVAFPADAHMMELAYSAAEQVNAGHTQIGRVASGDQFVASPELKDKIIAVTGAPCRFNHIDY